jgi:N-acetylmuramoyl-L-alanine amidase
VIDSYQRVYMITPRTPYADNALIAMARLYEENKDNAGAIKTLKFLLRDYPSTPFKQTAEKTLVRLTAANVQKPVKEVAARDVPPPNNPSAQKPIISVDNVRFWDAPNSVRIMIDLSGEVTYSQGDAKNPKRFFVDLSPAKLNSAILGKQWQIKSPIIEQMRVGQFDASTVRVVLEVGTIGSISTFTLRDPDRLIIDILGKEAIQSPAVASASPAATPTPSSRAVSVPRSVTPPPTATTQPTAQPPPPTSTTASVAKKPPEADAKVFTAAKPADSGKRSLVRSLGLKLTRVVIDAGHGGHDTGSVGPTGYTEKELVLDVARRLKGLIETELGAEVVMTRSDDNFVPLENRTMVANQQEADLFISIHANSSSAKSVRGVETYFLDFTASREALETASRENAVSDRSIHELQDLVKKIMLKDKLDESRELAQHIEKSLAARKGSGMDRGIKQAPFVVLIGANMPSVLAEICFISNPQDEKLVKTPESRQAIAESLFEGVRSYAETLSGTKTAKTQDKTQE